MPVMASRFPDHREGRGLTPAEGADAPARISTGKLVLFCALTPAVGVAFFGLIVSLQVVLTGDSSSGWPHGWRSVVECVAALVIVGVPLGWLLWSERERLRAATRR